MALTIRPVTLADREPLLDHLVRVQHESGGGDAPFMPTTPAERDPHKFDFDAFALPLTEPKWRRGFAVVTDDGRIVGYAELKGDQFRAGLHRCELGIAVERPYRRLGFGRQLLAAAIELARASQTVEWIDLLVFGHNAAARALYRDMGFSECGTVPDRFRIGGRSIDDVIMTLRVE
jgi:ribosomal protein S18 acetylase RimI-like enzyme